jgi:4-hydroxy-3-polyprenylbenzoate decarboxylase
VLNNWVIVSIRKQYPWHAFKICHGLWGMGQMMFTKLIMVVDADVDVHNLSDVMFHVCANVDPQRDVIFTRGPADSLDHAPNEPNLGTKMGIDATHKLPGEGYKRGWPEPIKMDPAVKRRVDELMSP